MDRGPRTGVTGAVSASDLDVCFGVGARLGWALCLEPWGFDEQVEEMESDFI